ncbi:glycosyltransferase [Francisella adeliensis]|nr:glycosyltransferase [Francisella adeliensis]MBK2085593.1 glycosyltransferase [Francisella adeliensis]MBK2097471.1 glycosyltransferase [Francisella adeliensis]
MTEKKIISKWVGDINKPTVSICCITYNHELYIKEALDSFLMQETNFIFEILIDDDASSDQTKNIIKDYKERYPKIIKPLSRKNNVGSMTNFIENIKRAKGKYIALCEGDDYWTDPRKLQVQINEMQKYPKVGLSFHLSSEVDGLGNIVSPKLQNGNRIYSFREIITGDFHLVQTNTIVFKKEKLDNLNYKLFSQSPVGDVWIRACSSMPNGALFINKVMGCYRVLSAGSWSASMNNDERFIGYAERMIKSINDFDKYWDYKYHKIFFIYKNKFINIVIKRNISFELKLEFINKHKKMMSLKNWLQWRIIYSYPRMESFLKECKRIARC